MADDMVKKLTAGGAGGEREIHHEFLGKVPLLSWNMCTKLSHEKRGLQAYLIEASAC